MNTNEKFAAFRLSKDEMNRICGGVVDCVVNGEHVGFFRSDDEEKTEESLQKLYGTDDVNCTRV